MCNSYVDTYPRPQSAALIILPQAGLKPESPLMTPHTAITARFLRERPCQPWYHIHGV